MYIKKKKKKKKKNIHGRTTVYFCLGSCFLTGLPKRNGKRHVAEIANVALDIMNTINHMDIPHMPGVTFRLRIGCHSGNI